MSFLVSTVLDELHFLQLFCLLLFFFCLLLPPASPSPPLLSLAVSPQETQAALEFVQLVCVTSSIVSTSPALSHPASWFLPWCSNPGS